MGYYTGEPFFTYQITKKDLTEVSPPALEPVSLSEIKLHLAIDYDQDDSLLEAMLVAARIYIEETYNISITQRQYSASVPLLAARFDFPFLPLASVDAVSYYDSDNNLQVLFDETASPAVPNTQYYVKPSAGFMLMASPQAWPSLSCRPDAAQVLFTAGYTTVPAPIIPAIKLLTGDMYENREASSKLQVRELPTCKNLLRPYRVLQ